MSKEKIVNNYYQTNIKTSRNETSNITLEDYVRILNQYQDLQQENQQLKEYKNLIGKYLNGYKIVKVEKDPFIKGQINLWTDEVRTEFFGDRTITKFFVREDGNSSKIYMELIDKELYKYKSVLDEIREYIEKDYSFAKRGDIPLMSRAEQLAGNLFKILDKVKE